MFTLTGFPAHACIVAIAVGVVVPTRLALKRDYGQQRSALQKEAVHSRVRALAQVWNGYDYKTAEGPALADAILGKVDGASFRLSDLQFARLKLRLHEVVGYLVNPQFVEYYRLKTEGFASQFDPTRNASNLLALAIIAENQFGNVPAKQTLRSLWDAIDARNHTQTPAKITAVSLNRLKAATSRTNSYSAVFGGKVANGHTVIQEMIEPGFHYGGQTNAVSSDAAQGLFFHLSFFARSSASTNAGPVYLSLYWSEPDQNWALSRMFADTVLNLHLMF